MTKFYCREMLTQNKVAIIRSGFIHCKTDFLLNIFLYTV